MLRKSERGQYFESINPGIRKASLSVTWIRHFYSSESNPPQRYLCIIQSNLSKPIHRFKSDSPLSSEQLELPSNFQLRQPA